MLSCLYSVIQNGSDKVGQASAKGGGARDKSRLGPRDAPERNLSAISEGSDVRRLKRLKGVVLLLLIASYGQNDSSRIRVEGYSWKAQESAELNK